MDVQIKHLDRRSIIKDLSFTVFCSVLIAFFLWFTGIADTLTTGMIISLSIGLSICTMVMTLLHLLRPKATVTMWILIFIGIILGSFLGWNIGWLLLDPILGLAQSASEKHFPRAMLLGITFGTIVSLFFVARYRFAAARAQVQEERIKRLTSEKETLEARLRLLQAQIEPHFLFNTLSNIRSLMDMDPGKGKGMLMDLITYLRTSLERTREGMTTLGQEMEILEAYLNIVRTRMGGRLDFGIDVPEDLAERPFPPMLLQPLVENAVKHGLESKVDGGEVTIRGREEDGSLRLEVVDTGLGFSGKPEPGVGLANVRDRLRLVYGEKARLILEENTPRGVRAVIEVPQ